MSCGQKWASRIAIVAVLANRVLIGSGLVERDLDFDGIERGKALAIHRDGGELDDGVTLRI